MLTHSPGAQSDLHRGRAGPELRTDPQRAGAAERSLADGTRRGRDGQDRDPSGRHGGHVRDPRQGRGHGDAARGAGGGGDRDARDSQRQCDRDAQC